MTKLPKLVNVEWQDATYNNGYNNHGLMIMNTAGFLVVESDEYITVSQDFVPAQNDYRNSSSIPRVNIIKIDYLRKGK